MPGFYATVTALVGVLLGGIHAVSVGTGSMVHYRTLQRTTLQRLCSCPTPSLDLSSPIPPPVTSGGCCSSDAPIRSLLR